MTPPLVEETIVALNLNGVTSMQWRCTPTDLEALVIGRLYIEAVIRHADDAHVVIEHKTDDSWLVLVRTDEPGAVLPASRGQAPPIPAAESFTELFRALFSTVDTRHEQGGMHAAAATDGQRIIVQVEDVGRHNTIDKVTGALLLQRLAPVDYGLLTSSRVSGEIADKAARAGFAWLASRSIPTSLAVRFASAAHMPIIGRAAGKGAFIYT
ncbi:MAG TPA: formate dehydrogenase accessory sulfurtransferase FdhD [Longimicrobiales bacterium]